MYSVAIVEDEESAAEILKNFLERYAGEKGFAFSVTHYFDAEKFLSDYHFQYDIVFMDIEMPCINGLSAAHRLRKIDDVVALVFITNLARYAINGYEVKALDYILKPLHYGAFSLKIRKIVGFCERSAKESILISFKGESKKVSVNDIQYVEICAHDILYHMVQGTERAYGTLKEIRERLDGCGFALCNRCYFVNLRHVKQINGYTVLVGNEELTISRPQKKEFSEAFRAFLKMNRGR